MPGTSRPAAAADLEPRIQALEDRAAIQNLAARYGFAVDDRDIDTYADCFTEDGNFRSDEGRLMRGRGREAVVAEAYERLAMYGPTNHVFHQHLIELDPEDANRATGKLSLHAEVVRNGEVWISSVRYADEYRRCEDGRWRIADRLLSVFYYLKPEDYVSRFGNEMRNLVLGEPIAASIPEKLATYRKFHEEHPPPSR
ncbi:nuclear transport factor 2 family protein [Streptomyces acidicola]|uniref:nuclear transport factor 2 family protein n=1 Tax=Streptomyces acidicola TaxID=2596892 RepID=UPI00382D6A37